MKAIRRLFCFSFCIFLLGSNLTYAGGMPDLQSDSDFRTKLKDALFNRKVAFDFEEEGTLRTFILDYGPKFQLQHSLRGKDFRDWLDRLVYTEKEEIHHSGYVTKKYQAQPGPQLATQHPDAYFDFELSSDEDFEVDVNDPPSAYLDSRGNPRPKMFIQVGSLLKRLYEEKASQSSKLRVLKELKQSIEDRLNVLALLTSAAEDSPEDVQNYEKEVQQLSRESAHIKLKEDALYKSEVLDVTSHREKIKYVIKEMTDIRFPDISNIRMPDRIIAQIVEKLNPPPFETYNSMLPDHEAIDECRSLGGSFEPYLQVTQLDEFGRPAEVGDSGNLCRFDHSAIGEWTLHGFKNDATRAFLDHPTFQDTEVPHSESDALVPVLEAKPDGTGSIIKKMEIRRGVPIAGGEPALRFYHGRGERVSHYCKQQGGKNRMLVNSVGETTKVCVFDDGSAIESQTLFNGPAAESNWALAEILNYKRGIR